MSDLEVEQYDYLRDMYGRETAMKYIGTKNADIDHAAIATEALVEIMDDVSMMSRQKRINENVSALLSPWITSIIVLLILGVYYVGYTSKKVTSVILFMTAAGMTVLTPVVRRSAILYYQNMFAGRSTLEERKINRTLRRVTTAFYTQGPLRDNRVQQTLMKDASMRNRV